ncbi:TRAP transporter small permease [Fodinicurvata halophila]|uniref:TRAP transporter small permease protein n=1 Tax=Fodinicurvata halophila TaxID=1419723 RepID=A0ABV8UKG6_9PROT
MQRFLRAADFTTRLALVVSVMMLIIAVATGFYQVLTRFVFNAPSTWSEVLTRSAMIWSVFLAMAACFRWGYMMAVEVIYQLVPKRGLVLVEAFVGLACLLVLWILLYYGIAMTLRVSSQTLSGLYISIAWIYAAIPVGAAFSILAVLARLLAQFTGREELGRVRETAAETEGREGGSA